MNLLCLVRGHRWARFIVRLGRLRDIQAGGGYVIETSEWRCSRCRTPKP